jgi:hypothetical protein
LLRFPSAISQPCALVHSAADRRWVVDPVLALAIAVADRHPVPVSGVGQPAPAQSDHSARLAAALHPAVDRYPVLAFLFF